MGQICTHPWNSVTKTLTKIKEPLTKALIQLIFKGEQIKKDIKLDDYPEVGLVADVTFQTRTRPKMMFKEAQFYFSGKHHSYGLKTEVAYLPNGLAAFVSDCYGGSVHEINCKSALPSSFEKEYDFSGKMNSLR